jgi:hypothetical protein
MGLREFWLSVVQPWQERRRLNEACAAAATATAVRQPGARPKMRGRK